MGYHPNFVSTNIPKAIPVEDGFMVKKLSIQITISFLIIFNLTSCSNSTVCEHSGRDNSRVNKEVLLSAKIYRNYVLLDKDIKFTHDVLYRNSTMKLRIEARTNMLSKFKDSKVYLLKVLYTETNGSMDEIVTEKASMLVGITPERCIFFDQSSGSKLMFDDLILVSKKRGSSEYWVDLDEMAWRFDIDRMTMSGGLPIPD